MPHRTLTLHQFFRIYIFTFLSVIWTERYYLVTIYVTVYACDLPNVFNDYLNRNVDVHSHDTRQQHKLHITKNCRAYAVQTSGVKKIRCYDALLFDKCLHVLQTVPFT